VIRSYRSTLVLHTGERARRVCSAGALGTLGLGRLLPLLHEEEGLDGGPLGLGHGLKGILGTETLGTGSRHRGLCLWRWEAKAAILLQFTQECWKDSNE
jgi:hypothetical protein